MVDSAPRHEQERSEEYLAFGPVKRGDYKPFVQQIVEEGLDQHRLNPADRIRLFENLEDVEYAFESQVRAAELKNDASLDIVTVLEDVMLKLRQWRGDRGVPMNDSWADLRTKVLSGEQKPELLDAHHFDAERYSQKLVDALLEAANDPNRKPPVAPGEKIIPFDSDVKLKLLPVIMRFHDIFKWLGKFGDASQVDGDHEEIIRYFIRKHFKGRSVQLPSGERIKLTDDLVEFMAKAAGNHENIYEEQPWSKERATDDDQGNAISLLFVADTMTNAIIFEKTDTGTIAKINPAEFRRFTDLAERHLRLFVNGEQVDEKYKNFQLAKAYKPDWILTSTTDFFEIVSSWEKKYGVQFDPESKTFVLKECLKVLVTASESLAPYKDKEELREVINQIFLARKALEKRLEDMGSGDVIVQAETEAMADTITKVMSNRGELTDIAKATGMAYVEKEKKAGRSVLEEDHVLSDEEERLIIAGPEQWRHDVPQKDTAIEQFARNTVGMTNLARVVALLEYDEEGKKFSCMERIAFIAGDIEQIPKSLLKFVQIGSRGAHCSWYSSTFLFGTEQKATTFDSRGVIAASSDWLQVQAAADYIVKHHISVNSLEELFLLLEDREFMVKVAKYCDASYKATQKHKYEVEKKTPPSYLDDPLFTPEMETEILTTHAGIDSKLPINKTRLKYAQNAIAFSALQEGILDLAERKHESAFKILERIIKGEVTLEEKRELATLQGTQYWLIQYFKGTFDGIKKPDSIKGADIDADWEQLREAAIILWNEHVLSNGLQDGDEEIDLTLEATKDRPTMVLEAGKSDEQVRHDLDSLGIGQPDAIFMFSGGAVLMDKGTDLQSFKEGIIAQITAVLHRGEKVLFVTGGTDQGFMAVAGEIAQTIFDTVPNAKENLQVLGVSPKGKFTFDESKVGTKNWGAPYMAARAHTHHLLLEKKVEGKTGAVANLDEDFSDETPLMEQVLRILGQRSGRRIAIVGNGGVGTAKEIQALIRIGYPILLIENSGRVATLTDLALQNKTYEEYVEKVKQIGDAKLLKEINNIFYILPTDQDFETYTDQNGNPQIKPTQENYVKLRERLVKGRVQAVKPHDVEWKIDFIDPNPPLRL